MPQLDTNAIPLNRKVQKRASKKRQPKLSQSVPRIQFDTFQPVKIEHNINSGSHPLITFILTVFICIFLVKLLITEKPDIILILKETFSFIINQIAGMIKEAIGLIGKKCSGI